MAGENIIRDFTTEQLKYIYDEVIDNPLAFTYAGVQPSTLATVDHTAIVEKFYGVEYASILGAASGERDSLRERNNTMAQNLIKTWEDVGTIDTRYKGLFSTLKSTMQEYLNAVDQIAEMINVNNEASALGIWAPNAASAMDNITDGFNKKMQEYYDACVNDALNKMEITDPDERQKIKDFIKDNNFENDYALSLILSAQTIDDKKVLLYLAEKNYSEIFKINPDKLSADMLQNLSDYANILAINDKWDEIKDFVNAITEAEQSEYGLDGKKYASEYLAYMEVALSRQLGVYNEYLRQQMLGYNADGSINWKSNSVENNLLAENIVKLNALDAFWQTAMYLQTTFDQVNNYYYGQTAFRGIGTKGISFDTLSFDTDSEQLNFNFAYQVEYKLKGLNRSSATRRNEGYNATRVTGQEVSNAMGIATGQYMNALTSIQSQRAKAWDKLNTANGAAGLSFVSSLIPGGTAGRTVLKTCLKAAQQIYVQLGSGSKNYEKIAFESKNLIPQDAKEARAVTEGLLSIVGNIFDYTNTMKSLNVKETEENKKYMEFWFGSRTNLTFNSSDKNFKINGNGFSALSSTNYKVLYAQDKWSQQGILGLLGNKTLADGATPVGYKNVYGFDENSLLYKYIDTKYKSQLYTLETNKDGSWVDFINNNFSDVEKLLWFGSNPSNTINRPVDPPSIGFQDINTSEQMEDFSQTIENIQNSTPDAFATNDSAGETVKLKAGDYNISEIFNEMAKR